jgi:hypothetical protein
MAQTLYRASSVDHSPVQARSLNSLVNLRLAAGLSLLLSAIIFFVGVSWDIQWHSFIGRDRTLIPPHVMMLLGVTISGLAALSVVLIETRWVRHNAHLAQYSTAFAGGFSGSAGAYIAGFGALNTAIAFVLDSYWHALYGIDVTIWAPFHVMLLAGMVISGLGAAYMLISVAQLAGQTGAKGKMRAGYLGASAAFSAVIAIIAILIIDGTNYPQAYIVFPGLSGAAINVFPFLAGLTSIWILIAAIAAIPWRWAATVVSGFTVLLVLLMAAFVPAAMDFLMAEEHLVYREVIKTHIDPHLPLLALEWPLTTALIIAVLLDLFTGIALRKGWSRPVLTGVLALVALPACFPVFPIVPLDVSLEIWHQTGMGLWFLLSLGLGLLGILLGIWFGRHMGEAMRIGR